MDNWNFEETSLAVSFSWHFRKYLVILGEIFLRLKGILSNFEKKYFCINLKLNSPIGIIIKADRQKGNAREIIARENRPEIYFWREKTIIACLL